MKKPPVVVPAMGVCNALAGILGVALGGAALAAAGAALAMGESLLGLATLVVAVFVLAKNGALAVSGVGLLFDRPWARGLILVYAWWGLVEVAIGIVVTGVIVSLEAFPRPTGEGLPIAAWGVAALLLLPLLGAPFPALQLAFGYLASVRRHFGVDAAVVAEVGSSAPEPEEIPVTATAKILAFAGSAREASLNKQLVRAAAEGARAAGAEVTVIDLRDLPMPIFDGDLEEREGLPDGARELKRLLKEHDGLLLACPEYNSSITPLLKNAIDWASRAEQGEQPLECFKGKVAGLLSASPGGLGGLRGLVAVRSILGNIGVVVVPEQVAVSRAFEVFDQAGRLTNEKQRAAVENVGRRVAELAHGARLARRAPSSPALAAPEA